MLSEGYMPQRRIIVSGQRTGRRSRHEETKVIQNQCCRKVYREGLVKNQVAMYAFFLLDIDNFKQANGRFGHVFRDMAIKEFITVIRGHIRENDILGRNRLCLAV
ncbi:diguanylate cyclase domain-containing protein [Anaerostipes faecis]|uniref:diguanylate cyclase domain-containing protein n=1 Tax=Anaerostipes faecis TaxID=2880702 RepID=UPI002FE6CDFF